MNYITVKDLGFAYDQEPVLAQISFTISPGEFVVLTGENGAAKSTLLKNILGILTPSHGSATLSKHNNAHQRLTIGYLPQQVASFNAGFPSTVYELVASGRFQRGKWLKRLDKHDAVHIKKALQAVGMWDFRNHKIGALSGGQKQKICLARIFAADPDLFILDEPETGMDAKSRQEFYELLQHEAHEHQKAILMVTHANDVVHAVADRQIHLVRMEGAKWRCFSMASCNEH